MIGSTLRWKKPTLEPLMNLLQNTRTDGRGPLLLSLLLLATLAVVALLTRPLVPIDETRYVSAAWEMWLRGDFLVPFKNGEPYSHKPPFMFWMFHAGWALFGVNDWWPRLVLPLFSAGALLLTFSLARRLWPQHVGLGGQATLVLVGALSDRFALASAQAAGQALDDVHRGAGLATAMLLIPAAMALMALATWRASRHFAAGRQRAQTTISPVTASH